MVEISKVYWLRFATDAKRAQQCCLMQANGFRHGRKEEYMGSKQKQESKAPGFDADTASIQRHVSAIEQDLYAKQGVSIVHIQVHIWKQVCFKMWKYLSLYAVHHSSGEHNWCVLEPDYKW